MSLTADDEGSFASGRQALLDALQALEQRAHERAERILRDAERGARQLNLDSEQHAFQVTSEAEERARQLITDAEQRSKQLILDGVQRIADLDQQLGEVRENVELARTQLEEQLVAVRGLIEVTRANLNTVRERLATTGRLAEAGRGPGRVSIPPLSMERPPAAEEEAAVVDAPTLSDLRAAVDALKRPRRGEVVSEPAPEPEAAEPQPDTADQAQPKSARR